MSDEPNYLAYAFKSQYNLIGLGTALGFSILSLSPWPFLVAAGVDMVVLPLLASNGRFQRLVRARLFEESRQRDHARKQLEASEMLQQMPDSERQAYRQLQSLATEIRKNYAGLTSDSQTLLDSLAKKLDLLLTHYLRMRHALSRYQGYFGTTDPKKLRERISKLEQEISAGPERVRAIKTQTKAVLEKRLERHSKALENRQLIEAQTETVVEVLRLLGDQSYSMTDPRAITDQLDGLVASAELTERDVRSMEELLAPEMEALPAVAPMSDVGPEPESRPEEVGDPASPATVRKAPTPVRSAPPPRKGAKR